MALGALGCPFYFGRHIPPVQNINTPASPRAPRLRYVAMVYKLGTIRRFGNLIHAHASNGSSVDRKQKIPAKSPH